MKKLSLPSEMGIPPVLQKIVNTKKEEILRISLSGGVNLPPKSLKNSLLEKKIKGQISIIAECKKASPSAGVIRSDYDPVAIAKIYEKNGAAAISVLTDEKYFQGSLADLANVSAAVSIPVLRKDFIIDEKQIEEARLFGASAVLLIARILSPDRLKELLAFARDLGMDSLVEIHNRAEAETAVNAGAEIIGINTRDLDTFEIHNDLVAEIAPFIPAGCVRVAESGIDSASDLKNMAAISDAALIGSYFMKSPDINASFVNITASL